MTKTHFSKMKLYVFGLLVVAAVALALPIEDEMSLESLLANEDESLKLAPVEVHHRERRVTCDLASGLGVGHSLCAAHCITKGYTGGSCTSKGICSCRKKKWRG